MIKSRMLEDRGGRRYKDEKQGLEEKEKKDNSVSCCA